MVSPYQSMGPPTSHHRSTSSGRQDQNRSASPTPSLPGNTSSQTQTEPPKGRALSCSECKRRKIKCDRGCPCGPCVLRNDQARCKPVIRWEAGCSLSEFAVLQNRVYDLESKVSEMQQVLGGSNSIISGQGQIGRITAAGSATSPKLEAGTSISPTIVTASGGQTNNNSTNPRGGGGEDDAVMMLEDFAMGNRANTRRAAHKPRPGDSPESSYTETGASQRSADAAIDVAYRFLRLAPTAHVSRTIVDYYFDRLEWYTKCLHRTSYMKDLQQLLRLDVESAARSIRPSFLSVHFMVLCLAIHLASTDEVLRWGIDMPHAMQLCDALFAGAQQLLWASDFIGTHQLEHLQAVVLISVYAYNVDSQGSADAAYALVGASIKIAQNLCLNRLDDAKFMEKERAKNRLVSGGNDSGPLSSVLERELGKRVWWYLIWLDWSHALSHGGSYSIHPAHNKTNLPANVNDEDLEGKESLLVRPTDEYTSMSFTIWRLRFVLAYRETIDLINQPGGITHAQVLEMDKKLTNLLSGLPPYFQLRSEDSRTWVFGDSCHDMELLSIQITAQNRILRLHRPYLAKGLQDRNSLSRKRCVDAAFSILALFRHAKSNAPILLRLWINIYYVFSGALVLFLDLCYDNDADARAAEDKRMAVREMLDICSEARHLSAAAKNTHDLLQGLLEAETELRVRQEGSEVDQNAGAKRKRSGNVDGGKRPTTTPFVSLVERVLTDAASKHGSGESVVSSVSMGKSPTDLAAGFDFPTKRHSTSYVRDRAASQDGRMARGSPLAGPMSTGAGHGGYFNEGHSSPYNRGTKSAGYPYTNGGGKPNGGTGGGAVNNSGTTNGSGTGSNPSSPWGSSSAIRSTAWNPSRNGNNPGFASPTGPWPLLPSPTMSYQGDKISAGTPMGGGSMALTGGPSRTAETTNGLSSLLDEDIFSGLLMNQTMGSNEWESAFAFVAPPPSQPPPSQQQQQHQQQQQQHHHQQHHSGPPQTQQQFADA